MSLVPPPLPGPPRGELQVSAQAFVPPGTYYLGAAMNSTGDDERELFMDNNTWTTTLG